MIIKLLLPKGKLEVLDLGCGTGVAGEIFNKNYDHSFVGVDVFDPYLKKCERSKYYQKCIKQDLRKFRAEKKYDVVILFQVIEHLKYAESKKLLQEAAKSAKKAVIVTVPNGECDQHEYDKNPYQKHKSEWNAKRLRKLGYRVHGQGLKFIFKNTSYGHQGRAVFWQKIAFVLSFLLSPITFIVPNWAAQLIAVKYTS